MVDPDSFEPDHGSWDGVYSKTNADGVVIEVFTLDGHKRAEFAYKVTVYAAPRWTAHVTMFNPSRLTDPDGTSLCDPSLIAVIAGAFVASLNRWLSPLRHYGTAFNDLSYAELAADFTITRLDATRDFITADTARWRTHIATLKAPYWTTNTHGIKNGVPGTVTMGTKDQVIKMYDKHLESRGRAPAGTLRTEVQTRTRLLRAAGITTIVNATPDAIERLLITAWERAGCGNPVSDGRTYDAIAKLPVTVANKLTLLGYLQAASDGQPNGLSAKINTKYNRLAVAAGISVGDPVRATGGVIRRLDILSGREIVTIDVSAPM